MKVVVIGGSGGIGHAVVSEVIDRYPNAEIIATYHRKQPSLVHERVRWLTLDVTSEEAIAEFSNTIDKLDWLINAVGFLHSPERLPEKTVKSFDVDFFQRNLQLNTLPSILLAKYFMKYLKSERDSVFLVVSAKIGSIADNRVGGWLSYRTSKAALNMALKTIAIEWRHKVPKCRVLLFHPGTTDTALSAPFQKGLPEGQLQSAKTTARCLLDIIGQTSPADSGKFFSYTGDTIDW